MAYEPGDRIRSGRVWGEVTAAVAGLGELVTGEGVPTDDLHRAEGYRYLGHYLEAGLRIALERDDPLYPEFGRMIENRMSWGLDNPDTSYAFARVASGHVYRVTGSAGSACHLELQVNSGHFGDGNIGGWRMSGAIGSDDLVVGTDGSVEILIGGPRRAHNWLPLDDDAGFVLLRQYFNDWEAEQPADLVIERVGAEYPPPPTDAVVVERSFDTLLQWLQVGAPSWAAVSAAILSGEPGPVQPVVVPSDGAGLQGQAYGMGPYRCAPDEAVIVEFVPPACRMWSVSLATWFWESPDVANRQCSLNGSQANLDEGVFRGVLAHTDPGVANWIDVAGYEHGTLAVRFLFAPDQVASGAVVPEAGYRVVALADLDGELPDSTQCVTAEERWEIIERRRRAVTHRVRHT